MTQTSLTDLLRKHRIMVTVGGLICVPSAHDSVDQKKQKQTNIEMKYHHGLVYVCIISASVALWWLLTTS